MEKISLNLNESGELIIREGKAPENFKIRAGVNVQGNITVPLVHLSKETITETDDGYFETLKSGDNNIISQSYLHVNRDELTIKFIENDGLAHCSVYEGNLTLTTEYMRFGINNSGKTFKPSELATLVYMNRSYFDKKSDAMRLVSELRGFEAKVNKEVEQKADERANKRILFSQVVQTNLPESFFMMIPIFKGQKASKFEIEIGIDANDLSCRLISPEIQDYINEKSNEIIDDQLKKIEKLHPELRIFEV